MTIPHTNEPDLVTPQVVLHPTARDAAILLEHLPGDGAERELPGSERDAYLDDLIVKPWGDELRVYDDRWMDAWRLDIRPGMGTSLHAHRCKHTWLVCMRGEAVLTTGAGEEFPLAERTVVHIQPGALHATFTEVGVDLLEIELPRDKLDLVRIGDRYGRAGRAYEHAAASRGCCARSTRARPGRRRHGCAGTARPAAFASPSNAAAAPGGGPTTSSRRSPSTPAPCSPASWSWSAAARRAPRTRGRRTSPSTATTDEGS